MGIKIERTVVGKVECDGCGIEKEYEHEFRSDVTTGQMEALTYQHFKGRYGWTFNGCGALLCPECVELRKKQDPYKTFSVEVHRNICPQCGAGPVVLTQMYTNVERYGSKSFVVECRNCKTKLRISFDRCVLLKQISTASKDTGTTW